MTTSGSSRKRTRPRGTSTAAPPDRSATRRWSTRVQTSASLSSATAAEAPAIPPTSPSRPGSPSAASPPDPRPSAAPSPGRPPPKEHTMTSRALLIAVLRQPRNGDDLRPYFTDHPTPQHPPQQPPPTP